MTITIITPAYNRSATLPKLYDSLKKQTSKDFEWIVIDDGSMDNTTDLYRYNFLKSRAEDNAFCYTVFPSGSLTESGRCDFRSKHSMVRSSNCAASPTNSLTSL